MIFIDVIQVGSYQWKYQSLQWIPTDKETPEQNVKRSKFHTEKETLGQNVKRSKFSLWLSISCTQLHLGFLLPVSNGATHRKDSEDLDL